MRYAKIISDSIAEGCGFRVVLYTQGCFHNCDGCYNPTTHSFNGGILYDHNTYEEIKKYLASKHISGLSIVGGEPLLERNLDAIKELTTHVHNIGKNTWLWTGYDFDKIPESYFPYLKDVDVLITGPYKKDLPSVQWRGSSNQQIYDNLGGNFVLRK